MASSNPLHYPMGVSTMTKQDYALIAAILRSIRAKAHGMSEAYARNIVTEEFVARLKADNERFNADLFRDACNPFVATVPTKPEKPRAKPAKIVGKVKVARGHKKPVQMNQGSMTAIADAMRALRGK
jgi:hypothetical protein